MNRASDKCRTLLRTPTRNAISQGEEKAKGTEKIFKEIISENVSNVLKNNNLHVKKTQGSLRSINLRRFQHIIVEVLKGEHKEKL